MSFRIVSSVTNVRAIAKGRESRGYKKLIRQCKGKFCRKLKGSAWVKLPDGSIVHAEIHWYEANGVGRKRIKI